MLILDRKINFTRIKLVFEVLNDILGIKTSAKN